MYLLKKAALFAAGGAGYVGLELLWRGRSHASMFLAGGTCLLLIGHLEEVEPKLPFPLRCLAGAGIITMVELGAGLLFNRSHTVWDYRSLPMNYMGQICLPFCLLWIPISALAGKCYLWLDKRLPLWGTHNAKKREGQ